MNNQFFAVMVIFLSQRLKSQSHNNLKDGERSTSRITPSIDSFPPDGYPASYKHRGRGGAGKAGAVAPLELIPVQIEIVQLSV